MNGNTLTFEKPSRSNLIQSFGTKIAEIGFQFRATLLENDLTKGEVRDSLGERLLVDLDHLQSLFLQQAREADVSLRGNAVRCKLRLQKGLEGTRVLGAVAGAGGGALAGNTALAAVVHVATSGFWFWKSTEVVTVAGTVAAVGLSPVLVPIAASVVLGGAGWMAAGKLAHRSQQKRWRKAFGPELERLQHELMVWAEAVLGPDGELTTSGEGR